MVYKLFDKNTGSGQKSSVNEELSQELHKPVIEKFKRRKVYARFKDSIWAQISYLSCGVHIFNKHAWVKPLKDEIAKTVLYGFVDIVSKSKRKPNKFWVDKGK